MSIFRLRRAAWKWYNPDNNKILADKGGAIRLTAAGWLGDHWYSEAIDFLNPFSDLSDLIELVDESAEISE